MVSLTGVNSITGVVRMGAMYDGDAQAFFTASGITNETQKDAVNTLVLALKDTNLWARMKCIYPMVGGTSTTHAVNLRSPGTYNLTFYNSPTHDSNGVSWNGSTQYADTGFNPYTSLGTFSTHMSYYTRTADSGINQTDMGVQVGSRMQFHIAWGGTGYVDFYNTSTGSGRLAFGNDSTGYLIATRTSVSYLTAYKGGVSVGAATTPIDGWEPPNASIFIGATNASGAFEHTVRQCAFATIGDGLDSIEGPALHSIVQAFQTTLSRQV